MTAEDRPYLDPYLRALRRHGPRFESLLWASRHTQLLRFQAIARLWNLSGLSILDAGCGRADLLLFLVKQKTAPSSYVGIEAMAELAEVARLQLPPACRIIQADFVREPARLLVGADVIVFCGSLNTLSRTAFYSTLDVAWPAARLGLVFNFLCSPRLASAEWLTWHRQENVLDFARARTPHTALLDDYYDGDCTITMRRQA